jgi:DNA-binding LacI/PurR family transcriptional regulator
MDNSVSPKSLTTFSPIPKKGHGGLRKDEVVEQYLLQKITSGEILPGTKLPSTADMATQLGVNLNSLQKALMRLSARGFLARKTNMGTFVTHRDEVPSNVFLLVGPCLRDEVCHFDRRLSKLIEAELFARGYNPIIYDGLDELLDRNSPSASRLSRQLLSDFAHFDPKAVVEQNFVSMRIPELVRDGKRPIVSFRPLAQGGDVSFDSADFYVQAVRAAVERGRKNVILVLKNPKVCFDSVDLQCFWKATHTYGLNVEKIVHIDDDRGEELPEHVLERALTAELKEWKSLPPRKRWDSIILRDDILTRSASHCFLREGISVPDDILPITLVNEDIDLGYGVPVVGVEVPISEIATSLVDILNIRLGRSPGKKDATVLTKGKIVDVLHPMTAQPVEPELRSALPAERLSS